MNGYRRMFSREHPGCVVFLVEQSLSMADGISGTQRSKADAVSTAVNKLIASLIAMCDKGEDRPRHWFDVAIVGYTTDANGEPVVGSAFGGALAGRDFVAIPDLAEHPLDIEIRTKAEPRNDGSVIQVRVEFPVWYRMPPEDKRFGTPTSRAYEHARAILQPWVKEHPESFPPMVIQMADGLSIDDRVEEPAVALKSIATADGHTLLCICDVASERGGEPDLFPVSEEQLPGDGHRWFALSSAMPTTVREAIEARTALPVAPGSRWMVNDADTVAILKFLSVFELMGLPWPLPRLPAHLR